jgi:cyclopropane fatty-acyl-phospholipid synthase-like methyltransferase
MDPDHDRTTVAQFTAQAAGFSQAPPMNDAAAMRLLLAAAAAGPGDAVLDVACGPGIVAASSVSGVPRDLSSAAKEAGSVSEYLR